MILILELDIAFIVPSAPLTSPFLVSIFLLNIIRAPTANIISASNPPVELLSSFNYSSSVYSLADQLLRLSQYKVFWFFDHSSGHTAFAEDALNARCMNFRPGGKQLVMHDTIYNGKLQKMVLASGTPKGMKLVLEEGGVNVSGMKAEDTCLALQQMHDFKYRRLNWRTC